MYKFFSVVKQQTTEDAAQKIPREALKYGTHVNKDLFQNLLQILTCLAIRYSIIVSLTMRKVDARESIFDPRDQLSFAIVVPLFPFSLAFTYTRFFSFEYNR